MFDGLLLKILIIEVRYVREINCVFEVILSCWITSLELTDMWLKNIILIS